MSEAEDQADLRMAFLQKAYDRTPELSAAAMQTRGPWLRKSLEGWHPEYGKQIADFLASIMSAPMALGPRGGVGAAALEHQAPNPAIMGRMRQGHFDRTGDLSVRQATQPVPYPGGFHAKSALPHNDWGPPPPPRSELATRPGVLNSETFYDKFDPVMLGVLRDNIFQGPAKPANVNGPRSYSDALNAQNPEPPQRRMTMEDVLAQEAELRRLLGLPELPPKK